MRLPGSFNTKNGDRLPVSVIVDRPLRHDISDLAEWLDEQRPVITHKTAMRPDNPFLAADIPGVGGAPVDIGARLASMRYEGTGDTAVHATQLSVSSALLNRSSSIDDTVDAIMKATKAAAGEAGARWDWDREARDIRAMCLRWQEKKAKANGASHDGQQPPKSFSFRSHRDQNKQSPRHLNKSLLPEIGTGLLAGQSGVYKSFVGLKLAGAIATGQPFISGYSTKRRGATLIFLAKGWRDGRAVEALTQAEHSGRGCRSTTAITPSRCSILLACKTYCDRFRSERHRDARSQAAAGERSIRYRLGCSGFRAKATRMTLSSVAAHGRADEISQATGTFVLALITSNRRRPVRAAARRRSPRRRGLALLANKALSGEVTACRLAVRKSRSSHAAASCIHVRSVSLGLDEDDEPLSSLV